MDPFSKTQKVPSTRVASGVPGNLFLTRQQKEKLLKESLRSRFSVENDEEVTTNSVIYRVPHEIPNPSVFLANSAAMSSSSTTPCERGEVGPVLPVPSVPSFPFGKGGTFGRSTKEEKLARLHQPLAKINVAPAQSTSHIAMLLLGKGTTGKGSPVVHSNPAMQSILNELRPTSFSGKEVDWPFFVSQWTQYAEMCEVMAPGCQTGLGCIFYGHVSTVCPLPDSKVAWREIPPLSSRIFGRSWNELLGVIWLTGIEAIGSRL